MMHSRRLEANLVTNDACAVYVDTILDAAEHYRCNPLASVHVAYELSERRYNVVEYIGCDPMGWLARTMRLEAG